MTASSTDNAGTWFAVSVLALLLGVLSVVVVTPSTKPGEGARRAGGCGPEPGPEEAAPRGIPEAAPPPPQAAPDEVRVEGSPVVVEVPSRSGGEGGVRPARSGAGSEPRVPVEDLSSWAASRRVRLPADEAEGHARNPVFSASGTQVAFELHRADDRIELWLATLEGTEWVPSRIDVPGGRRGRAAAHPAWHPRGLVVFEGFNERSRRLYSFRPGAPTASELIPDEVLSGALGEPAISPEGDVTVFVVQGDLWRLESRTGRVRQLTTTEAEEGAPSVSRTGAVVFERNGDLFEVEPETGGVRALVVGPGVQSRGVYAGPRGRTLVWFDASVQDDRWDIRRLQDGDDVLLAVGVSLPTRAAPAVSPDGRWVGWAEGAGVTLSRLDGSRVVELGSTFAAVSDPALGARRRRLMLAYAAEESPGGWQQLYVADVSEALEE